MRPSRGSFSTRSLLNMHELAICQALLAEISAIAENRNAIAVVDIHVGVGPLSGVDPGLLADAFTIAAAGTIAESASLHLRTPQVRVRCGECEEETVASANKLVCGRCGNWRTTLVSGDELLLERVEMKTGKAETMGEELQHV